MAAVVASQPFEVGQRVKDGVELRGTVRYVGPVVTSKKDPAAIWVGVEWDDGTRGKHDGSVVDDATGERVRYFRCGATAGSFVKPSKVDGGGGLVAALRAKYVGMDAPVEAPGGHFEHKAYTKRGNTKAIEFCGELKVRAAQHKRAKFPTSKAHISAVFHSFRLIFGRAIIPRDGLEAWMFFPERACAEHSR